MNFEKNRYEKLREICKPIRIVAGAALISVAVVTGMNWFYLGIIPLVAGATNFCPTCTLSGKCRI